MANELYATTTIGLTVYAVLLNSVGQIWNGAAFVTINGANWTSYDIALTEGAAGIYVGNMPAAEAGAYSYVAYKQAGGASAVTDSVVGTGHIEWDGTAELALTTIESQTDDIGVAGAGLTALGDTRLASIAGSATIADAVWDEALSGHTTSGTSGSALADAPTAAEIWTYSSRVVTLVVSAGGANVASTYQKGDLIRVTGAFTTSAGVATDPTAVFCTYKDPSGNSTTLTYGVDVALAKDSTGTYHVDIDADEEGVWFYRFYATGTGQSAGEHSFNITSRF
jgi:hypothetical protein